MRLVREIDVLLRGGFTRREDLAQGRIKVPTLTLVYAGLMLGAIAGACTGLYGVMRPVNGTPWQLVATTLKVPLLFLLTLVVTLPSLYVFSALARSSLRFADTMRLLLAAIAVNLALLASLGPVVAFFTLSTKSYSFILLLNVTFFAAAGFVGLMFLRRALDCVFEGQRPLPATTPEPAKDAAKAEAEDDDDAAALPAPSPSAVTRERSESVFRLWIIIYGVVGAQMGWILRPFIGSPDLPFTWFRERESSFFGGVIDAIRRLIS